MNEKGIKRMSASQFRSAKALIQNLCANYDAATKTCLALDDGTFMECPQMTIHSVCCSYFRDVLLEDKDGQLLKSQLYQPDFVRQCKVCGQTFRALSNRATYCAQCSRKRRLQKQREYMANRRLDVSI